MKTIQIRCEGTRRVDIDDLTPFQGGLKDLDKKDYEKLKKEILETGYAFPIKVWKESPDNKIFGGHQTLRVLKTMRATGYEIPPVPVEDVSAKDEAEAKRRILQDASSYGKVNSDGLEEFLHNAKFSLEFAADSFRLPDVNLDRMFEASAEFGTQGLTDQDEIPEVKETRAKTGDIWVLGDHRLVCGDSTAITDLDKLMAGEKADLWLTDPPYGVAYKPEGTKHDMIANDDLPLEEMAEFWTTVASNAHMHCSDKAPYYWFACQGGDQMMMMMMSIGRANWKVRHELIWVKDTLVMSRCDYHYRHEPILYGWKKDGTHEWYSDRKQTSVIEFPRPKRSEDHPTMKPVDLVEYLMKNSSKPGDIVLDTFGGSGTTLMAAEKSGRMARLVELSPKYCSVILARWEAFTGKTAELMHP